MTAESKKFSYIVGVCGLSGALKSELAKRIAEKFETSSIMLSSFIPTMEEKGRALHPVDIAERIHADNGGYFAERALESVDKARIVVIDGLRHPQQLQVLRTASKRVFLLEVTRPTELRHKNILECNRGYPPIEPHLLDHRHLYDGLQQLLSFIDYRIATASEKPSDLDEVITRVWPVICRDFRDAVVDWAAASNFGRVFGFLQRAGIDAHLVGGVNRDFIFGGKGPANDIDLVLRNDDLDSIQRLDERYRHSLNRFGGRRYLIEGGETLDVWRPMNFLGQPKSILSMLRRFDLSINAIAVGLKDGTLIFPAGSLRDINCGIVSILVSRWCNSSGKDLTSLFLRALSIISRYELQLGNPDTFRSAVPDFGNLDHLMLEQRLGSCELGRRGYEALRVSGVLPRELVFELRKQLT